MSEPLAEWRFGKHTIMLVKKHTRYLVGYSRDDDGHITGTGFPLSWIVMALALAGVVLAGCIGLVVTVLRRLVH